jgi:guanylate cyclase, other
VSFHKQQRLLRNETSNTAASDIYSFGILLYEVYSRKDPYEGEATNEVLLLVSDPKVNKRPPTPKDCPAPMASLMSDCLVANPEERPTFVEVDQRLKRVDVAKVEPTAQITDHRDRSTVSLFDIFPKHIAEALRDGKEVQAEHRDVVTIFFSDIGKLMCLCFGHFRFLL